MRTHYWLIPSALITIAIFGCLSAPAATTQPTTQQSNPTTQISSTASPAGEAATAPGKPAEVMKPGDYTQKFPMGDAVRTYLLHVPPGYDGSNPLPLLFVLHGFGGNAAGMVKTSGLSDKADLENFFAVYLNGSPAADNPQGGKGLAWNSGLTPELGLTVDDVAFVRDLSQLLEQRLYVDNWRVYAAGFSNGGFMAHRLGAELSGVLAGVAVVEGTIGLAQPGAGFVTITNPVGPMPIIIIHGKADTHVPYDGGQATAGIGKLNTKSVADAVAFWTQADGCKGTAQPETSDNGNVIKNDYAECAAGSEVLLYTVVNGGHEWPTLQGHTHFSAADAIWDFFSRHSLP